MIVNKYLRYFSIISGYIIISWKIFHLKVSESERISLITRAFCEFHSVIAVYQQVRQDG